MKARQGPSAGKAEKGPARQGGVVRGGVGGLAGVEGHTSLRRVAGVPGWTRRDERVSSQRGSDAPSDGHEAGGATSGKTVMKSDVILHLEDAAFARRLAERDEDGVKADVPGD